MPGVTAVQRKDSSGQMGQMFQMAKTAYDTYKGAGANDSAQGGPSAGNVAGAPPPAVPTQPDQSTGQAPPQANSMGAINRRMAKTTGTY